VATASVDHTHAASTACNGPLQRFADRRSGLAPVKPVEVDLFVDGHLALAQPSDVSPIDPRSDPFETLRLVSQQGERPRIT
jgi:hypothetical protein